MSLHQEAQAALEAKRAAEQQLISVADCPPWRHAVFALLMAGLVGTTALPLAPRLGAMALILFGVVAVVRSDRRRMGLFVNGYRRGKTRIVTFAMLALILPLYVYSARAGLEGDRQLPLLLAGLTFVISLVGSIVWQRVFVRELGA